MPWTSFERKWRTSDSSQCTGALKLVCSFRRLLVEDLGSESPRVSLLRLRAARATFPHCSGFDRIISPILDTWRFSMFLLSRKRERSRWEYAMSNRRPTAVGRDATFFRYRTNGKPVLRIGSNERKLPRSAGQT